jgi:diguanylate cyclase (GGDEF)-like protein/PAS domain S-box-containing protein
MLRFSPARSRLRFGARSALIVGALLVVLYFAARHAPRAEAVVYQCASLLALGAVVFRIRAIRCSWPGRFFAVGLAAFAIGDLIWALQSLLGLSLPWSWLPDAAYLASYPAFAVALVGFAAGRREQPETLLRQLVDAALVFVSGFTAVWFLALQPHFVEGHSASALLVVYPTLDLILLALAARGALSSGRWSRSYLFLTGGFAFLFAGDLAWRLLLADGAYAASSWINTLFMVGYVLWAAAALEPSFLEIVGVTRPAPVLTGPWRRLSLLALATGVPAAVMLSGVEVDRRPGIFVFAASITLIPILGLVRVADVLRVFRLLAERAGAARDEVEAILAHSPVPIAVFDAEGVVRVWNEAAEAVSGWRATEVVGAQAPIVPLEDDTRLRQLAADALSGLPQQRVEATLAHRDGHAVSLRISTAPLHTPDGRVVALFEDVTLERTQAAEIEYLANFDPLTNLPNRHQFKAELVGAVAAARAGLPIQIALFDLDGFKTVNDDAGHAVGDRILHELANLVRNSVRANDFVARSSGDEFGAIFWGIDVVAAECAAQRVVESVRDYRLEIGDTVHDVTLSAGVYSLESDDSPERALRRVDEALYRAKELGKNRTKVWGETLPVLGSDRIWSIALKDALRDGRIDLHAQPVVSLRDGSVAFHEALARIRRDDGTIVPACDWIEPAERLGLIPDIDVRMLENAEAALRAAPGLVLFVNLSASSFYDARVMTRLEQALDAVPPGTLGIEITEHVTLRDPERAPATLARLRSLGAAIAIDDFGLGFTSFTELATLPCDLVKIPAEFTRDHGDLAIAGAISAVAHHYGKRVVIEGVEDADLAGRASDLGIELAQGWHFGRPDPLPAAERQHRGEEAA